MLTDLKERDGSCISRMYTGGSAGERLEAALSYAAELLGSDSHTRTRVLEMLHPDVIVVSPPDGGGIIKVADARRMTDEAYMMPSEGRYKILIISEAQFMNEAAQNALLKTLEEPPPYARFVLCCGDRSCMLATVRSRTAEFRIGMNEEVFDGNAESAAGELVAALIKGESAFLAYTWKNGKIDAKTLQKTLLLLARSLPDALEGEGGMFEGLTFSQLGVLSDAVLEALAASKRNVGTAHILGALCARFFGKETLF